MWILCYVDIYTYYVCYWLHRGGKMKDNPVDKLREEIKRLEDDKTRLFNSLEMMCEIKSEKDDIIKQLENKLKGD